MFNLKNWATGEFSNIEQEKEVYAQLNSIIEKLEELLKEYINLNRFDARVCGIKVNGLIETIGSLDNKIKSAYEIDSEYLHLLCSALKKAWDLAKLIVTEVAIRKKGDTELQRIYIELLNLRRILMHYIYLPALKDYVSAADDPNGDILQKSKLYTWNKIEILKETIYTREVNISTYEMLNPRK